MSNNDVWEEERVSRRLDLAGTEDDDGGSEVPTQKAEAAYDKLRPSAATTTSAQRSAAEGYDWSDERWSDITDPFEEFHFHGELEAEDVPEAKTQQPPASRRSQFLRAVSMFSPAHQLVVLEVREEQGVSLLDRNTSLTAEPLDFELGVAPPTTLARSLSLPGHGNGEASTTRGTRSCSLATEPSTAESRTPPRRRSSAARSAKSQPSRRSRQSLQTSSSKDSTTGSKAKGSKASTCSKGSIASTSSKAKGPKRGSKGSIASTSSKAKGSKRGSKGSAIAGSRKPSSARAQRPSVVSRDRSHKSGSSTRSPRSARSDSAGTRDQVGPVPPDLDPDLDPTLATLLRDLWTDPPRDSEPKPKTKAKQDRDWETDADVLSGLWRMLESDEDFFCSPPGFHAFRQDKPHWLDREPVPWSIREAAREKCNRWLQSCPAPPGVRARELRMGRRETLDSLGRSRSRAAAEVIQAQPAPPPGPSPRSLTSTPALADHVPAITALRKLKKYQRH